MKQNQILLLVEDLQNDRLLLHAAFLKTQFTGSLQMVADGEQAIAYLKGEGDFSDRDKYPLPAVMLLDLNLPKVNGFNVLSWVRSQPKLKRIVIIILTASTRHEDVERAFDLGANAYLVKPSTMGDLITMALRLRDWLELNRLPSIQ